MSYIYILKNLRTGKQEFYWGEWNPSNFRGLTVNIAVKAKNHNYTYYHKSDDYIIVECLSLETYNKLTTKNDEGLILSQENLERLLDKVVEVSTYCTTQHLFKQAADIKDQPAQLASIDWSKYRFDYPSTQKAASRRKASKPKVDDNIKNVYFNDEKKTVHVIWKDGSHTQVRCDDQDAYSREAGLALCYMKKQFGNKGDFNDILRYRTGE